jgi:DNA polymerase
MTCEDYVRDERFKWHMVGVKIDHQPTVVLRPKQLVEVLPKMHWGRLGLLCQNTEFDAFILAHHLGIRPAFYLDTLSMMRAFAPHQRSSLANIAKYLKLSKDKGGASGYSVVNTRGVRDLDEYQFNACASYCADDCDLTWEAWQIMKSYFKPEELRLIDQTIRFFVEPILLLDPVPLEAEVIFERDKKAELIARIGGDVQQLSSGPKFAALLENLGVVPPVKPSPTALKKDPDLREVLEALDMPQEAYTPAILTEVEIPWTYAFGKNDKGMLALQNHDDPLVVAAVEARIGVKSTLAGTRAARLLGASGRGAYPVSLNYAGAHTLRESGSGGCNVQNLPGKKPGQSTRLRQAFLAPPGHSLVVCDLNAIECRGVAYLAGEDQILDVFRSGGDIYCDMASTVFQRHTTKAADPDERQIGKTLILSCGYSMSWKKFQENMYLINKVLFGRNMADMLGISVNPILTRHGRYISLAKPQTLTMDEFALHCAVSEFLVKAYRDKYTHITGFWRLCLQSLQWMLDGEELPLDPHGVVTTFHTGVRAPWGGDLQYMDLACNPKKNGRGVSWSRASREGRSHLHPGLVTENVVQWLSRHIIMYQSLKLKDEGLKQAFRCHDEIVGVCRDEDAPYWKNRMFEVMSAPIPWLPGLPLGAEAGIGKNYFAAK